jgi:hypothetical protein
MRIALNFCAARRCALSKYSRTWSQNVIGIEAFLCGGKLQLDAGRYPLLRVARKGDLSGWVRQNCPTGKSPKSLSSPF